MARDSFDLMETNGRFELAPYRSPAKVVTGTGLAALTLLIALVVWTLPTLFIAGGLGASYLIFHKR